MSKKLTDADEDKQPSGADPAGDDRCQTEAYAVGSFGLTRVMILAAVLHIVRGEYSFVPIKLVMGGVVYGQPFVSPARLRRLPRT
jgi:hypothetical protein